MTLVVSLRVPDGVILAADSLQTSQVQIAINPQIVLDSAGNAATDPAGKPVTISMQPISIPTSTSAFAQKLFSFKEKFGIAIFGQAILNGRTIYNHIKNLENKTQNGISSVSEVGKILENYFTKELDKQLKETGQALQPGQFVMGFQVVGFESEDDIFGHTIEVQIGAQPKCTQIDGIGCTVSGDTLLVSQLFEIAKIHPQMGTNYASFSLKDAIDYAEFLINTTASYQRFANMIPTVGGAVDIALITNYSNFKWIKSKELTKILEKTT